MSICKLGLAAGSLLAASVWMAHPRPVQLNDADLHEADLAHRAWAGVQLNNADLVRANLSHADLRGAGLRLSSLADATLQEADLSGANLEQANLMGADLRGCLLTNANLQGALYSAATLWPSGFQPVAAGARFIARSAAASAGPAR